MVGVSRARTPKAAGEAIEAEVIQEVGGLRYVGDNTAEWHDARVDGLLEPSDRLPFIGVVVLETGTPVEIKAAQRRLNSGRRGRYYIRQRQHERLVQEGASYLFAVYQPQTEHLLAMLVVPATVVEGLLPDGWTDVEGDRAEEGYRQLAWSNLFDPSEVEG